MSVSDPPHETGEPVCKSHWYWRGVRATVSVPGLILASAFVGFAALAKSVGIDAWQAAFMTLVIWALPAKVVLLGAISSGAPLPAAALAVALSSVRLMPMVVSLVPEMRDRDTPRWQLYALSHFVAVTSWVLAMEQLRGVPRPARAVYYAGLGGTLVLANAGVVLIVYAISDSIPAWVAGALFFLTPIYFLTSLWGSAREQAGHIAMVMGLIVGPIAHVYVPEFDLLVGGLVAGLGSYVAAKALRTGRAA